MKTIEARQREIIGKAIKAMRTAKGVTQTAFALHIGMTQGAVSLVELGRNSPSLPVVIKMADFLGVSVDSLLGRKS